MLTLTLSGIALGFVVAAPIGPVNIAVIRRGLASGFYQAWMLGLGAALADALYVIVVFLGLAPFLQDSLFFRLGLWSAGGAFLIYLGAMGMRPRDFMRTVARGDASRSEIHPFLTGLGITLLNPMTVVSWLAIGGAFFSTIALAETGAAGILFVAGIFIGSALWSGGIALVLHLARRFVSNRVLRAISIIASLALIGFGLGFLFQAAQAILR
jgi:threonine/homoserine/homoserine lactone efflux protein